MFDSLVPIAAILVILTSFTSLGIRNWRISFTLLAVQFIGATLLITQSWSIQMSFTILISGVIGCLILSMAVINNPFYDNNRTQKKGQLFRSLFSLPENHQAKEMSALFYYIAGVFIVLLTLSISGTLAKKVDEINQLTIWITLILVSFGLLEIGLSSLPLVILHGLLTLISGFEIIFSFYDTAVATAGILSLFNLGAAIVGAYLISTESMEEIR